MPDHFKDTQKIQELLHEAQMGLWVLELNEGKEPRMYADHTMLELLGFSTEPAPEECYRVWYDRIDADYYDFVQSAVERITSDGRAEVQYTWHHPKWGEIFIRCGGKRDFSYTEGVCLRGYHQNITNTFMLKKEYDIIIQTLGESYTGIFLCNLDDQSYKAIKVSGRLQELSLKYTKFGDFFRVYSAEEVAVPYRPLLLGLADTKLISKRLSDGEKQIEIIFRDIFGGWRRIKLLPIDGYSSKHPFVIAAFDEQDDRQQAQMREDVLSTLCQCYYSIYLFDLDNDMEESVWQEEFIRESREFPKGSLSTYYDKFIRDHVFSEDKEKMRRAGSPDFLRNTLSAQHPVYDIDFRRIYPEGLIWVRSRFSIAEIKDGRVSKVIFANMQIHEQKMKELEEQQQKRLYFESQNIIRGLSVFYHSVFHIDLLTESFQPFNLMDDLACRLGSSTDYEYLKTVYSYFIHEEDRKRFMEELSACDIRRRITGGDMIYALEYRRNYGGAYGWMRMHIILAESRNGVPVKVILAAHSVEEEKEQEERNRKALLAAYEAAKQANEAKSNFLAQMSHDIRTPLNAITGMSSIALSQAEDPEKVRDCLKKITLSSHHLIELINDVLDMSKIEKGKLELAEAPFSLKELLGDVESILSPQACAKKQELCFHNPKSPHDHLCGDAGRIRQVLINLITNAIKYTPDGGRIDIAVQEVSSHLQGYGCLVFTVADTGIGMSKDFLDYIFVPFSRAEDAKACHIQGTGLGMPIALGIVTAMQGNIQVESEPGKGSRFTVTLHLKLLEQEAALLLKSGPSSDQPDNLCDCIQEIRKAAAGRRLLLAEDNELNMEIAQTILGDAGFTVDGAVNGDEAYRRFLDSEPGTYFAILMDLQMPVMDGYTAARKIRSSHHPQAADIMIIALTANAFAEDVTKALTAGMNDHVAKPIDYRRLYKLLLLR